jgi:hypothetical protein
MISKPLLHPLLNKNKDKENSKPTVFAASKRRSDTGNRSVTRSFGRDISSIMNINSSSRQSNHDSSSLSHKGTDLSLGQKHAQSHSYGRKPVSTSHQMAQKRASSIRSNRSSRERLQEIGLDDKRHMFNQRCEKQIF